MLYKLRTGNYHDAWGCGGSVIASELHESDRRRAKRFVSIIQRYLQSRACKIVETWSPSEICRRANLNGRSEV